MANVTCQEIPADTLCGPSFAGYLLDKPVKDFNESLRNSFQSHDKLIASLTSGGRCTDAVGPQLLTLRNQILAQCTFNVQRAIKNGCAAPAGKLPTGPLMCLRECQVARDTLDAIMGNKDLCPKGDDFLTVSQYSSVCETAPTGGNCITSVPSESIACGFSSVDVALKQCKDLPNDQCCLKLLTNDAPADSTSIYILIGISLTIVLAAFIFLFKSHYNSVPRNSKRFEKFTSRSYSKLFNDSLSRPPPVPPKPEPAATKETYEDPAYSIKFGDMQQSEQPSVQPGELIPAGSIKATVIHEYTPTSTDELAVILNSTIYIIQKFEDGWALAFDPYKEKYGAIPLVCVQEENKEAPSDFEIRKRESSVPPQGIKVRKGVRFVDENEKKEPEGNLDNV